MALERPFWAIDGAALAAFRREVSRIPSLTGLRFKGLTRLRDLQAGASLRRAEIPGAIGA